MSVKRIVYTFVILLIFFLVGGLIHINHNMALYREKVERSSDCPENKPFKIPYSDECQGCDYPECLLLDDRQIFSECKNRENIDGWSCLKSCPDGWTKVNGTCYNCAEVNNIALIYNLTPMFSLIV